MAQTLSCYRAAAALLFAAALASSFVAAQPEQCASVKSRAPCGQTTDSEADCLLKQCCYAKDADYPCFYAAEAVPIKTVHVIQACHLDVGYSGTMQQVINSYLSQFFAQAYALGLQLDARGGPERLRFMAQSWIVNLFLNCPPNAGLLCPSPAAIANFTDAVKRGYITWHAFPFNGELELGDASLLAAGVSLTHSLDAQFGLPPKATYSQRDVPGVTRAALPTLWQAGVRALSIGVNGNSMPAVAPRAFVWEDVASGTRMPVLLHPGGYGGIGAEEVIVLPGLEHAMVYSWRGDNSGPPTSVSDVTSDWAKVAALFPGADIVASTLDNFTALLTPAVLASLPVLTSEMGDTWVHGAASDPQKSAWIKLIRDARTDCIDSGVCAVDDPAVANFTACFIKSIEHTWGIDAKSKPGDFATWTNAELEAKLKRNDANWLAGIDTWKEQRRWAFDLALGALPPMHPLAIAVSAAMRSIYPPPPPSPSTSGWAAYAPGTPYSGPRFGVAFNGATGSIAALSDGQSGVTWASARTGGGFLAELQYWTFNETDYDEFANEYR